MSASEMVLHQMFQSTIEEYNPFADYLRYREFEDNFLLFYQGVGKIQAMAVDAQGSIVSDSTLGTTRSTGLLALEDTLLGIFAGNSSRN